MTPFPDEARSAFLDMLLKAGVVVRLFSNDAKVTPASKASDFIPADLPPRTFDASDWAVDGFTASAVWAGLEFTGNHVLRGWYATSNLLGGALLAAQAGFEVEGRKGLESPVLVRRRDILRGVTVRVGV